MQDDMVQVGHSRGIFDLSNCFCLDLNLEYVLMDFISRGSKFQATAPLYPTLWINISLIGRITFRVRPSCKRVFNSNLPPLRGAQLLP